MQKLAFAHAFGLSRRLDDARGRLYVTRSETSPRDPTGMRSDLHLAFAAYTACLAACMLTGFAYGLHAPPGLLFEHSWRLAGLLAVPGIVLGAVAMIAALLIPRAIELLRAGVERHLAGVGAALAITPPASVVWLALMVRTERHFAGSFHNLGLAALLLGTLYLGFAAVLAVGCVGAGAYLARRLDGRAVPVRRALGEPALVGLGLATALFVYGLVTGDELGRGGLFSVFAVLRQPEIDLIPALMAACIVGGTVLFTLPLRRWGVIVAPAMLGFALFLAGSDAVLFGRSPAGARIDARPGPVQSLVEALRRATDHDRDGFSQYFGGGDCDDRDPHRNPDAIEVPGNGVDEDCSGRDARALVALPPEASHASLLAGLPVDMNLVVFTVDTLRADMIGGERAREITPNLSRLAAQSVTFDRAYALSSNTMHAIGPMMSGRYPTECPRTSEHFTGYLPENVMVAERLRDQGFWTGGMATHFYFEPQYGLTQGITHWDGAAHMIGEDASITGWDDRLADRMLAALQQPSLRAAPRFLLWGHFFDPHNPYAPHPGLAPAGANDRAAYEREVAFTDRQLGRVLAALEALPSWDRTVVVVTADHGEAFGEHGTHWHGVELWEELVRVPLLIRVPGVAPHHVAAARSQIDLAPTLLELMRAPLPPADARDAMSGRSLVSDLVGAPEPERPIYIELTPDRYNRLRRVVLFGNKKLIERGAGRYELYDIARDPDERVDLSRSDRAALARMLTLRESVRARLRTFTPVRAPPAHSEDAIAGHTAAHGL
jgi:choline-sulfatase